MMSHVPDYRGRFLQGIETGKNVGDRLEAGLPNIWGEWKQNYGEREGGIYKGALVEGSSTPEAMYGVVNTDPKYSRSMIFNASAYNSIYKDDVNTVQPPSVIVKYIIKAE